MSALDLSSTIGLVSAWILSLNVVLGVLLGVRYNPWTHWPHRRFNYFRVHNWTAYVALALAVVHPLLLLADRDLGFGPLEILWPLQAPKQPLVNLVGALALYALALVVATSYWRRHLTRRRWKQLHFVAYGVAALFIVHGLLADPLLKDRPVDWLDAEKVSLEACALGLLAAGAVRWRMARRHARQVRTAMGRTAEAGA